MKKIIPFLLLNLILVMNVIAQDISGGLGYVYNLKKNANGISINLEYIQKISKKHSIGLGVSNLFTQSANKLPDELIAKKHILRSYENPEPIESPFLWTEDNFPKYHLSPTPNKFFDFNFYVKYAYSYHFSKNNLFRVGLASAITYHDEMELVEWIKGDLRNDFWGSEIKNVEIPVFLYDTYIDLGLIPQIEYSKIFKNNVIFGVNSKFYYYPKSKNKLIDLTVSVSFPIYTKKTL